MVKPEIEEFGRVIDGENVTARVEAVPWMIVAAGPLTERMSRILPEASMAE